MLSINKRLTLSYALLSFLGFLDASYLTIKHYTAGLVPCAIGNCEQVLTSAYSTIGPVPVALLGTLYYLTVLLLSAATLARGEEKWLNLAARGSIIGLAASLWFIFTQAFLIKAWCQYCLLSAATSIILFLLGYLVILRKQSTV